ncbi:prepilin-type N-terminal cleavage/methylation domain-containing protein [Geothrix sp.]|uniref:type IV pilus modification PilV family protein n=1 Tax=Geothrix sp. TaxID=1962974 RepID=UPI002610559A|nr:prepilin-type N-terminal cleavage/methylation domain-containing protein [Geothrix sp.]WIL21862.1 MAG: prepilin-type N-terminal cleavage/methylation domain-containing protein [Geothrix sp.]
MTSRASRQSGFTLVELLMTALIFGIGLLGLAALQVSTLRSNSGGRNRFTATALAEGCLSAIQSEGNNSWIYSAGIKGTGVAYPLARVYTGGNATGPFGSFDINGLPVAVGDPTTVFTVQWSRNNANAATPKAPIMGMDMREFVVTVTWRDQAVDASGSAMPASTLSMSRLIRY